MNEEKQPIPVKAASLMRRAVIYAVLFLVVFLVGFVPMWFKVRECSSSLSQAENTLSMAKMENALASAAIDARRGDYEPARQSASDFFTSLRAEIDNLISRSDPASADRLSDLYVSYRRIMKK
jgi:hypothetical protein